jgi:L-alanine-DL-glutamate epimerase-like enolase superfamily enzyme
LGKPILVKVHAEGVVGYGQIRPVGPCHFMPDTVHSAFTSIAEVYAPAMVGRNLFDVEDMSQRMTNLLPGNPNARAAIDHAVYDAIGKALGLPVHQLIGGLCQELIPLEWSVGWAPERSAMIAEAQRAVEEFGVPVLCLKAGRPDRWREDVANFAAVREAVGPDVKIGVDANTGWTFVEAVRALKALDEHDLGYVEQPIERADTQGLAALRDLGLGVPIIADESLFTLRDARTLVEARAVDAFCIKLYKVGGLHLARKIAAIAEAGDVRVNVGGLAAFSQLEAAAGAHFYASLPERLTLPAAEFMFGLGVHGPDPLVPESDFVIESGHVRVPTRPGLGVPVDEEAVARLTMLAASVQ